MAPDIASSFTIATWNVQWQFGEWEQRQPAIAATLAALDAPVVTLQETWRGQIEQLAADLGYEYCWAGHDHGDDPQRSMGNAILSRWPVASSEHRFLEDAQGRNYRTILGAQLDSPVGRWPVFTTHLEHRFDQSVTRQSQLQLASEFIEVHATSELPPILAADLNAVHDSDEVRRLTGRSIPYVPGRIWTDAWDQVGDGPGITWSSQSPYVNNSAWPNRRLDYVMIGWPRESRPVGNPKAAHLFGTEAVDGVVPSDHYGLAVEIRL